MLHMIKENSHNNYVLFMTTKFLSFYYMLYMIRENSHDHYVLLMTTKFLSFIFVTPYTTIYIFHYLWIKIQFSLLYMEYLTYLSVGF